jgi:hypothetical protein
MDAPVLPHVPALIAAYMRAAAGSRPGGRTGPFTAGLDAHSDDPMRNYAVPDHDARPSASDTDALITFFRRSNRIPRLEYIEEDAPRAWPPLAAAGFTIECRTPVITATPPPGSRRAHPPGSPSARPSAKPTWRTSPPSSTTLTSCPARPARTTSPG